MIIFVINIKEEYGCMFQRNVYRIITNQSLQQQLRFNPLTYFLYICTLEYKSKGENRSFFMKESVFELKHEAILFVCVALRKKLLRCC